MIVSLNGKLIESSLFRAVIECSGVGYEVNIPLSCSEKLPSLGETVRLFTLQTFREDGQSLYGFYTSEERDFFKLLVEKVGGIGPSSAIKIFSQLSLPVLQDAIRRSDIAMLTQCPGVGKKTAERIVVELRDKIGNFSRGTTLPAKGNSSISPADSSEASGSAQVDAVAALVALGFSTAQADKSVRQALSKAGSSASTEQLVRLALGN